MYEAARREKKLKARINELVDALETLSKNSETRHQQTAEYVADLKKANGALVAAYEKAKKKHGARLRKLEQQMITMVERHDAQVWSSNAVLFLGFFLHFNVRTIQYGPKRHLSYKAPEATVSQRKNADDDEITNTHP
mgnify:CR=1 FL=1